MFIQHQFIDLDEHSVNTVLAQWKRLRPSITVLALLPEAENSKVVMLQSLCREQGVRVYGALFPELLCSNGFRRQGALLICLSSEYEAFLLDNVQDDGVARLTAEIQTAMRRRPPIDCAGTLFTIFDAMIANIGSLLAEVHAGLERAPRYVGVNAGSETFQPIPCLFDDTRFVQNGVCGLYFPRTLKSAVHHAYENSNSEWRATSSTGNRIQSIDGRPAFEVYQEIIQNEYGVKLTRDNFYEYAVHFPLGLVTAIDVLVRIPVGLGEDNSIYCIGEIAPNSILRLLRAPDVVESECASNIGSELRSSTMATDDQAILTFYCAGRRLHFEEEAATELKLIATATGREELFGALTLGEIDTLEEFDFPRFHNAAVVCIVCDH